MWIRYIACRVNGDDYGVEILDKVNCYGSRLPIGATHFLLLGGGTRGLGYLTTSFPPFSIRIVLINARF